MKQRFTLLCAFLLLFTSSAIFAQQKSANFLGTWKLAEAGNDSARQHSTGWTAIKVTEDGEFMVVEKISTGTDFFPAYTNKTDYKINGNTITTVSGGNFGGFQTRRLRFVKENKLQFLTSSYYDIDRRLTREIWTVSEDGKTLTVKREGKYAVGKMIFNRE